MKHNATHLGRSTWKRHGVVTFVALSMMSLANAQDIRATVDGNLVNFPDAQPVMMNGRVMVPVRGVFEHMKANVDWDASTRTVHAQQGNNHIKLVIDSRMALVNDRQVSLDTPATIYRGSTMVPLRFLSESLGATVEWVARSRTVEIDTVATDTTTSTSEGTLINVEAGTVVPFTLNSKLSSHESKEGDAFTGTVDTNGNTNYQGLPTGTMIEGHVEMARAKSGNTPGVLGLAFDRVRLPDGQTFAVLGKLNGLDAKSVEDENGRLVAKSSSKNDSLKYVGIGAGAGALVAIITKGNILTDALIGGALGYLASLIQKDPSQANDVNLIAGTKTGMRLTKDLAFRITNTER